MGKMTSLKRFSFKPMGHAVPALESRVDELRARLGFIVPGQLADQTGAMYLELGQGRGEFHLALLGTPIVITYPDFHAINAITDTHLPAFRHALLLYYFMHSDGMEEAGKWISFSELPDGRIYSSAFQGYTGDEIVRTFGINLGRFCKACDGAGGITEKFGDASYRFRVLPRMNLLLVYHLGDDDFPSTCRLLFDVNAGHCLPTEACAILGSSLAQRIVKTARD
jgi:hypothetical protein